MNISKIIKNYKKIEDSSINEKNNKIGWINLVLLSPIFFFWFWTLGTITGGINGGALASYYYAHSTANPIADHSFTALTSLFLIGNVFSLLFVALLVDRFPIKRVLNAFTFLFILGILGLFLSYGNVNAAIFFAFLSGFSAGSCVVPFLKLANQWFEPKNLSFPIGLYIAIGLFGGIAINFLFTPLSKIIISSNSNHGIFAPFDFHEPNTPVQSGGLPFLLLVIFISIIFLLTFFVREKKSLIKKYYIGIPHYGYNVVKTLKKPQNILVPLIIGLMNLPVSVIVWSIHSTIFAVYYHNISPSEGNNIISLLLIGNVIGSFVVPYLADYVGKRKELLIISNVILIAITFLIIIKSLTIAPLFIIYFLVGFFCSAQNIGYPMIIEQNSHEYIPTANSWNSMILLSVGAIIQNIFTTIHSAQPIDPHGSGNHTIPVWLLALIPILMVIPLVLSFLLIETGPKGKNPDKLKRLQSSYNFKLFV